MKQEVDDGLSACIDECSPCGLYIWRYKDLSMSCDQRECYYPQWRIAPWTSINELFLLPKFDSNNPSVPRDKEICQYHVIMS